MPVDQDYSPFGLYLWAITMAFYDMCIWMPESFNKLRYDDHSRQGSYWYVLSHINMTKSGLTIWSVLSHVSIVYMGLNSKFSFYIGE